MKKIIILTLLHFFNVSCKSQNKENYQLLAPLEFLEKLKITSNPQILDVRTSQEFITGHIKNAINVNWNGDKFNDKMKSFDIAKPIFVNCQGGGRSKKAAERLFSLGFKKIYELNGGINEWKSSSLPIKK